MAQGEYGRVRNMFGANDHGTLAWRTVLQMHKSLQPARGEYARGPGTWDQPRCSGPFATTGSYNNYFRLDGKAPRRSGYFDGVLSCIDISDGGFRHDPCTTFDGPQRKVARVDGPPQWLP
jgi:hypothetical protein